MKAASVTFSTFPPFFSRNFPCNIKSIAYITRATWTQGTICNILVLFPGIFFGAKPRLAVICNHQRNHNALCFMLQWLHMLFSVSEIPLSEEAAESNMALKHWQSKNCGFVLLYLFRINHVLSKRKVNCPLRLKGWQKKRE